MNISKNLPKNSSIINIHTENKKIKSENSYYELPFYKKSFLEESDFTKFIKSVEKLVRKSDKYDEYIHYIKSEIGLKNCQILGNVEDDEEGHTRLIEMHHGPILTLFDICSIVTDSYLKRKNKVNSFIIADKVLKLHFENKVQIVMLSESVHQAVHAGKIFIHPNQAFGDIQSFLEEFEDGLSEEIKYNINLYLDMADKNDTTDNDIFKIGKITNWSKSNCYPITQDIL